MRLFLILAILIVISLRANTQVAAPCYLHGRLLLSVDSSAIQNALVFGSQEPITRNTPTENLPNAYSDAEGRFTIALKGPSAYFRIVRSIGDTIDTTLDRVDCNSIRDIYLDIPQNRTYGGTYIKANVMFYLPEIRLEAYRTNQRPEELPAAVGVVDSLRLSHNDQTSLQQAVNTIPGVIMESRGYGGSHRLNIRGSSLRSPFAVRNVKLYLDGIPLTSADGQTPLELIDPADITQMEIIKGPAGSLYGNGNGGALLLKSKDVATNQRSISSGFQAASYGGYRWNNTVALGFPSSSLRISHNWQDYAGYREQEFNRKQQVSLFFKQKISDTQRISVFGTYYTGNWGLPGALNADQAELTPQSAAPFAITNNTYLFRERYIGAITHESSWLKYFHERTVISYQKTSKRNPYGTSATNSGYKDERADEITGRSEWTYKQGVDKLSWQLTAGAEWQNEQYGILEQSISNSFPASFKYLYDIGYIQWMAFVAGEVIYNKVLNIQGGYSLSDNKQFVRGRNAEGFQFDTTATYGIVKLPRLAASLQLHPDLFLFYNIAKGAANPTVFEMIDQENNFYNLQLKSEQGLNRELGIKQNIAHLRLTYSLSAYDFQLKNVILPTTLTTGPSAGIQLYDNVGNTRQQGIEWSVQWMADDIFQDMDITLWNSGSLNRYRFGNYTVDGVALNNNAIPGVPSSQIAGGWSIASNQWVFSMTDYYFDKTPLNNSNSIWSNPYHLLNTYADYRFKPIPQVEVQLHAGVNNLLNSSYTGYYALNGFGQKFYNPAANRNFFAGFVVTFTL